VSQTALLLDPFYKLHDTGDHPERSARLTAIEQSVAPLLPSLLRITPRDATESEVCLVHTPRYFQSVEHEVRLGAGELSTGDTAISEHSLEVALRAVGGVLAAVDSVISGSAKNAFCAVRPPGHHAMPARGMGFCIFNNIAIAARYAQKKHGVGKVLIVDWDVHHGNGTQEAFYTDDSILFFSSHQHPWYPGTGMEDETGAGRGLGYTVNAPLPAGSGFDEIDHVLQLRLAPKVQQFKPELILISAGFDSHLGDTLGQFTLTDQDFSILTHMMTDWAREYADGKLVSILEGGYNLETLASATAAHVQSLMTS